MANIFTNQALKVDKLEIFGLVDGPQGRNHTF